MRRGALPAPSLSAMALPRSIQKRRLAGSPGNNEQSNTFQLGWGLGKLARGLKVNDTVYAPRARLGLPIDGSSAFHKTVVSKVIDRSVEVDVNGQLKKVASSAAHLNIGVLILRIGDFDTELTLLDPLAKSLLQHCRLTLPDDMVPLRGWRTRDEMRH
jgi:hypothetical protein